MTEDRQIRIVPGLQGYREGAICFGTRALPEEVCDLSKYVFEHRGEDFDPFFTMSSLRSIHERLLLGQRMPPVLLLTQWWRLDQIMAATLFLDPSLVLLPSCTMLIQSLDLVDRHGSSAIAHIPWKHKEIIRLLDQTTQRYQARQIETEDALKVLLTCVGVAQDFLRKDQVPIEPLPPAEVDIILEVPTLGFCAFLSPAWAWDRVWGEGYLWGAWFGPEGIEVRMKSELIDLDTDVIQKRLGTHWEGGGTSWKTTKEEDPKGLLERLLATPLEAV